MSNEWESVSNERKSDLDPNKYDQGVRNTNLTDKEIDDSEYSAAGAVLNPVNSEHTTEEDRSAAGAILSGNGSRGDGEKVKDAAKGIPKNTAADKRDKEQKGQ